MGKFGAIADLALAGIKLGVKEGVEKGVREGVEKGVKEGVEKGVREGVEKGVKEGVEKGAREAAEKSVKEALKTAGGEGLEVYMKKYSKEVLGELQEKLGKNFLEKGGKDALMESLAKELSMQGVKISDDALEKLAQVTIEEGTSKITKEIAEETSEAIIQKMSKGATDMSDEALNDTLSKARDPTVFGKKLDEIDWTKLLKEQSDALGSVIKNHPRKTIGSAIVAAVGLSALILAADSYLKNNNKKFNIVKTSENNDTSIVTNLFGGSNGDIVIEYTPKGEFTKGDKVKILDTDFEPSINNRTVRVKEILSRNKIVINISDVSITKYATTGKIQIKTNMGNRILSKIKDNTKKTGQVLGGAGKSVADVALSATEGVLEGVGIKLNKDWIFWVCLVIFIIIILGVIIKVMMIFSSNEDVANTKSTVSSELPSTTTPTPTEGSITN
jgi:hypothetical protein